MRFKLLFTQQVCTFLAILFFYSSLSGQNIGIGIQAGMNLSGAQVSPHSNRFFENSNGMIPGCQFSLFIENKFASIPVSISSEPGILLKGYSAQFNESDDSKFRLTYISLPTLLHYFPVKRLGISIGPEVNYLVSASIDGNKNNFTRGLYERFEIAGVAGLSYTVHKKWTLGARYSNGLTPALKLVYSDDSATEYPVNWRNFSTQVFLRYNVR